MPRTSSGRLLFDRPSEPRRVQTSDARLRTMSESVVDTRADSRIRQAKRPLAEWPARRVGPGGLVTPSRGSSAGRPSEERAAGIRGRISLMRAPSSVSTSSDVKALFTKAMVVAGTPPPRGPKRRAPRGARARRAWRGRKCWSAAESLPSRWSCQTGGWTIASPGRGRWLRPRRVCGPRGDVRWTTGPMREPSAGA